LVFGIWFLFGGATDWYGGCEKKKEKDSREYLFFVGLVGVFGRGVGCGV
jgi:hypothetical protein